MTQRVLGLIVNPIAGLGGRVGLKGSDGADTQKKARALGAVPESLDRAAQTLAALRLLAHTIKLVTCPGEMGEIVARRCGFDPILVGSIRPGATSAEDTIHAARAMQQAGVDLLLFAGGDGTARDIYTALASELPVLGIPAGVKIHSAAFAINPRGAGELAAAFLQRQSVRLREAEVVDLDEAAYRSGLVATRLYGYLKTPFQRRWVQNQKAPTPATEAVRLDGIARDVAERMEPNGLYILGPGTTTRAIAAYLGLAKTLVGVDVVSPGETIALDVGESQLLSLVEGPKAHIIVTPIGGQGFLFGRGNQPISPRVIRSVGRENIIVVSTPEKLNALGGRPLLTDTGDPELDARLGGYVSVITGYRERVVYRVAG